jgi:acyl carrier protein
MNPDHIRKLVFDAIQAVAPEIEENNLNPDEDMREECDIDSIDFLNFLSALKNSCGVSIPEVDYSKVNTLNKILDYLDKKLD